MDSPISCNSSSSNHASSPQVYSPVPRRTPLLNGRKPHHESIPFLDLLEESEDRPLRNGRATSYIMEKLNKQSVEDMDYPGLEKSVSLRTIAEMERRSIIRDLYSTECSVDDIRPPSRACNPQINDQEFVKLDHELRLIRGAGDQNVYVKHKKVLDWL